MLDIKKLLTKMLDNMKTKSATPSITSITTGSLDSATIKVTGKVAQLTISVKKSVFSVT